MSTPDDRTAAFTTEQLAAGIRAGMAAEPILTGATRPVADRLTTLLRQRLPYITDTDTGALMIHLAAFLSDVLTVLEREGFTPGGASHRATTAIAMAGVELYDSGPCPWCAPGYSWHTGNDCTCATRCGFEACNATETATTDHVQLLEQLHAFLAYFREDDGSEVIESYGDDRLTVGMLRAAAAALAQPHAPAIQTARCDSYAHPDFVGDQRIQCEQPQGHYWHRNGQRSWTP